MLCIYSQDLCAFVHLETPSKRALVAALGASSLAQSARGLAGTTFQETASAASSAARNTAAAAHDAADVGSRHGADAVARSAEKVSETAATSGQNTCDFGMAAAYDHCLMQACHPPCTGVRHG